MPNKLKNTPKACERAKGAKQNSIQNLAKKVSHKRPGKARFDTFYAIYAGRKTALTKKVRHTLRWLMSNGSNDITSAQFGTWACRRAAFVHVLGQRRGLSMAKERVQKCSSWNCRYISISTVAI